VRVTDPTSSGTSIQDDFLTYDADTTDGEQSYSDAAPLLAPAMSIVTRTDSWDTMHSPTPVETIIIVTLPTLRDKIRTRTFLERSCITRIQVCQEHRVQPFHRFVLLELAREEVGNIWLRLDREGRGVVPTRLRGAVNSTEDTVSLFMSFRTHEKSHCKDHSYRHAYLRPGEAC
jgi:hypothetical protein